MKTFPDLSYVNGKAGQAISITDRGLHYGDGLFETILCLNGQLTLQDEHLRRLAKDSQRLHIHLDNNKLKNELEVLLAEINKLGALTGVVKIIISREYAGRGYAYAKHSTGNRLLQYYAGLAYPLDNLQGIRLSLSDRRLPSNTQLAGIKHLNRLEQVLAAHATQKPFYQESLLSGAGQELLECVSSNIFMVKNGRLYTPDLSRAGVQGVMRDYILSVVALDLQLSVEVKKLYIDDLMQADELFICNSVFGVWPVIAVHVREYPLGTTTVAIQRAINKLGYGSLYL